MADETRGLGTREIVFTQLLLLCDIYNSCRFDLVALLHYLKLCVF